MRIGRGILSGEKLDRAGGGIGTADPRKGCRIDPVDGGIAIGVRDSGDFLKISGPSPRGVGVRRISLTVENSCEVLPGFGMRGIDRAPAEPEGGLIELAVEGEERPQFMCRLSVLGISPDSRKMQRHGAWAGQSLILVKSGTRHGLQAAQRAQRSSGFALTVDGIRQKFRGLVIAIAKDLWVAILLVEERRKRFFERSRPLV